MEFKDKVKLLMKGHTHADFLRIYGISKQRLDHALEGGTPFKTFKKKIDKAYERLEEFTRVAKIVKY